MSSDSRTTTTAIDAPPDSVRVLIAEDDAYLRGVLRRNLAASGHVIVGEAATMSDAIERARELVPDVLLLDAHLGPSQIVEAAKTLAHDQPGIAVIFLSGDTTFVMEGDVAGTTAISVLPSSSPTCVLESSIKLALHRARELRSAREEVAEVRKQLENRKAIERAKGILMRRTGLSEQEAYRILQRTSQDRSVPMVDVAREVLESEPGR
jgi:AmiR/NasT family two-component response regulator